MIDLLESKKYRRYNFEANIMNQFEEHNIDVWASESRVIMLKEYRTQNALLEWEDKDQACIASALHYLPRKYLNNLYFFMVLDFNTNEIKLRLKINKVEKDEMICKKYILKDSTDLDRIPFLMRIILENDTFSFDEKFKKRIMQFDEYHEGTVEKVMNDYFNNYLSNKSIEKIKIKDLLNKGDKNVY